MPEQVTEPENTEQSTVVLWTKPSSAEGFWIADRLYRGQPGDVMECPEGVAQVLVDSGYVERTDTRAQGLERQLKELAGAEDQAEASSEQLEGGRDRRTSPPVPTDL